MKKICTWLMEGNGEIVSGDEEGINVWNQSERRIIMGSNVLSFLFKGV